MHKRTPCLPALPKHPTSKPAPPLLAKRITMGTVSSKEMVVTAMPPTQTTNLNQPKQRHHETITSTCTHTTAYTKRCSKIKFARKRTKKWSFKMPSLGSIGHMTKRNKIESSSHTALYSVNRRKKDDLSVIENDADSDDLPIVSLVTTGWMMTQRIRLAVVCHQRKRSIADCPCCRQKRNEVIRSRRGGML